MKKSEVVIMSSRESGLETLIQPVVEALDCNLWGIRLLSAGAQKTLRVYIDKPEGVSLEDCERVSRQISAILDVEDPLPGKYLLEVSSPGIDRPLFVLAQYERSIGKQVSVRLRVAFEGRKKFKGKLVGVDEKTREVCLVCEDYEFFFPVEIIEKANIVPVF